MARIIASPEFQRAPRLRAFLHYVVEQKLAGRTGEVTEVVIGHRVFGRPATYSPGEDSIVRTVARVLRQRLERYFANAGASEPLIIEIPRGGYIPVFRPRSESDPGPQVRLPCESPALPAETRESSEPGISLPVLSRRTWLATGVLGSIAGGAFLVWMKKSSAGIRPNSVPAQGAPIRLESSDPRLAGAFEHARSRVASWVFRGDPIGNWYGSSRDNRAFCMRDTAHESTGAVLLGLRDENLNMLRRFAASIDPRRQWCGYWIISKDGFAANYNNDDDFGYALPANFDLLDACRNQIDWTGDSRYLDPTFTRFYDRTVSQYVDSWAPDHDGIMKARDDRPRITASYWAHAPRFRTGADLMAAQYGGYLAYAAIQDMRGGAGSLSERVASEYRNRAETLRKKFNTEWWDSAARRFRSGILADGSWCSTDMADSNVFALRFGIAEDGARTEALLDQVERSRPPYDSTYSYYPEIMYAYGRNESAWRFLMEISEPAFSGYPMVETAFATISSICAGLMGIEPHAPQSTVTTLGRLPKSLEWARIANVPVARNLIQVEHRGNAETRFTNQTGEPLTWKAAFALSSARARIAIDAEPAAKIGFELRRNGQRVIWASAPVKPGQSRIARLIG